MDWVTDPAAAKAEQRDLRERLIQQPYDWRSARSALAIGVAFNERASSAVAVGVPALPTGEELDDRHYSAEVEVDFPYRSGLYAYREGPAVSALLESLLYRPDFLIFDAQGIAHPRGLGLAAHLSLLFDLPAFGITRNRLFGKYAVPPEIDGASSPMTGKDGEVIGYAYRMMARCDLVFASPGHKCDAKSTLDWLDGVKGVRSCFPASVNRAHQLANGLARRRR